MARHVWVNPNLIDTFSFERIFSHCLFKSFYASGAIIKLKFCIEVLQKQPSIYGMVYSDPFAIFSFFIGIVWTDIRCMSHRIIYSFFIIQKHADRRLISDTPGLAVRPFAVCISIVEFYHLLEEVFANFTARSDPALQLRK